MSDYNPSDPGAQNDDSESILRKHLNPAFKGTAWDALVAAMATGDAFLTKIAKLAYEQLFTSTASGKYLDRKAANVGVVRPTAIGMTDDVFRQYAIKTTASKLTPQVVLDVLEVFYGSQSVRAWMDSASGTFAMEDGDTLTVVVDDRQTVNVVFAASDFQVPSAAKAVEVASVINRYFDKVGCRAFAVNLVDPQTGLESVRLFSGTLGLTSSIQVTGGKAQNVLQFPSVLNFGIGSASQIAFSTVNSFGKQNVTIVRAVSSTLASSIEVPEAGHYVNLYDSNIQSVNRGSFAIESASASYSTVSSTTTITVVVTIANPAGAVQTISLGSFQNCYFFNPTSKNIYASGGRTVVAVQSFPGQFEVVLPATAPVGRSASSASYMQLGGTLALGTAAASTPAPMYRRADGKLVIKTSTAHGLSVGQQVTLDDVYPSYSADVITTVATSSRTAASYKSKYTNFTTYGASYRQFAQFVLLPNNQALFAFGHTASNPRTLTNTTYLVTASGPTADSYQNPYHTLTFSAPGTIATAALGGLVALKGMYAGMALAVGGTTSTGLSTVGITNTYRYNGSWTAVSAMDVGRAGHTTDTYGTEQVIAAGGISSANTIVSSTSIYSIGSDTWTAGPSLNVPRVMHQSVTLNDGRILVVGGKTAFTTSLLPETPYNGTPTNTCETYDGTTWTSTGKMTYARYAFGMCLLPDGRVFIAGGYGYNPSQSSSLGYLDTIEIFDPSTGRWSVAGKLPYARRGMACIYVPSLGKVAVLGGYDATAKSPTALDYWDVNTGKCSFSVSGTAYREYGTAVVFDTGLIMHAGGYSNTGNLFTGIVPNLEGTGAGKANGTFRVTEVPSTTTLVVDAGYSKQYFTASSATITPVKYTGNGVSGPYLLGSDFAAITGTSSTISNSLSSNQQYKTLLVADASGFPDAEGWLVFNYGTAEQVGPVRYLARISANELLLDGKSSLSMDVAAGSTVHLLTGKGNYNGTNVAGSLYTTDSSSGRVSAVAALDKVLAAGVEYSVTTTYPGDRGLGGEGFGSTGTKFSDKVTVWGGNMDEAASAAREE